MGAVFYDRRGVSCIDSASNSLSRSLPTMFRCVLLPNTPTPGAENGKQKVLPTGMCGSNTKLPVSRLTSAPVMVVTCQRVCPAGLSKGQPPLRRVFRVFLRVQKDTAATRSGSLVSPAGAPPQNLPRSTHIAASGSSFSRLITKYRISSMAWSFSFFTLSCPEAVSQQ